MKTNRLNRKNVRSTEKADSRLTTLSQEELKATVGSVEETCTCSYKYAYTDVS